MSEQDNPRTAMDYQAKHLTSAQLAQQDAKVQAAIKQFIEGIHLRKTAVELATKFQLSVPMADGGQFSQTPMGLAREIYEFIAGE